MKPISMKGRLFITFIMLLLLAIMHVEGQSNHGNTGLFPAGGSEGIDNSPSVMRMFTSLFLILALILVGVYILKKLKIYKGLTVNSRNPVSIIANISLGYKRSVCLLRIADEILIIGVTNNSINLLSKMKTEELSNIQGGTVNNNPNGNLNFSRTLKKAIQGIKGKL